MLIVKAFDLKFKYRKYVETRDEPKFSGLPDPTAFNRDDLYEILPMMGAVMDTLGTTDGRVLHLLEDLLNEMPRFVSSREEVFNYLVGCGSDVLQR
ncbi:MAG: hypothetical protein LWW87_10750 [Geobacteraceae bacterium]|nr:hypothetical protein [Geobacteraceae bacterium]